MNFRSFFNLQIWSKNSDFDRENSTLQYCPQFNFALHRYGEKYDALYILFQSGGIYIWLLAERTLSTGREVIPIVPSEWGTPEKGNKKDNKDHTWHGWPH